MGYEFDQLRIGQDAYRTNNPSQRGIDLYPELAHPNQASPQGSDHSHEVI